jgi:protein involved in polysaccharide export with SLBB domain
VLVLIALALAVSLFSIMHPNTVAACETVQDREHDQDEVELRFVRLLVSGHVAKPGIYRVGVPLSLDRLFDLAGGPTKEAVTNVVLVYRKMRDLDASEREKLPPVLRDAPESFQLSVLSGCERFKELSARLVDGNLIRAVSSEEIDEVRGFRSAPPAR